MYPYEGMFLIDPVTYGSDPEGVEQTLRTLLEKHGAEISDFEKWDERKLAYEIKGHRRGIYFLVHFTMPGAGIDGLRGDARITECILRQMCIRLDDDIPVFLEKTAKYYDRMREDQDARRGGPRRSDEEVTVPAAPNPEAAPKAAPSPEAAPKAAPAAE